MYAGFDEIPAQPHFYLNAGHTTGVQQTYTGFDEIPMPTYAGQLSVAAEIGEAMQAAQAQPSARPAADALQPARWKEGSGEPPAPCSAHPFPNLLQQAAKGPVPVALQADLASGQLYHGPGVYRTSAPPAPPAPALGGS